MKEWAQHFGSEAWFIGRKKRLSNITAKQKNLDRKLWNARCNELAGIKLINEGARNDYCNEYGRTALHVACYNGKDKLAMKIIENYPVRVSVVKNSNHQLRKSKTVKYVKFRKAFEIFRNLEVLARF